MKMMSRDYLKLKHLYKHRVLACCYGCRRLKLYKVTDIVVEEDRWSEKCDDCGDDVFICKVTKYQKAPGFARKCKICDFRFVCGTIRVEELPSILKGVIDVTFSEEEREWVNNIEVT